MTQKMMTDQFLATYKTLEGMLRSQDSMQTVLSYEDTLNAQEKDRLTICRQIRNYMQHHEDGLSFLAATPEMVAFLDSLIEREKSKEECAKDRLYKLAPVSVDAKLSDAAERFAKTKRDWMPVVDREGVYIGILTPLLLLQANSTNNKTAKIEKTIDEKEMRKMKIKTMEKTDSVENMCGEDAVVLAKGKYMGVLKW